MRHATFSRAVRIPFVLAVLASLAGCGPAKYYPVTGKILDISGNPIDGLEGAQVEFESRELETSSVGQIQSDGGFRMYTEAPGDGVMPGTYRVLIARKYLDPEN